MLINTMKKTLYIIALISLFSCKAQNVIRSLHDHDFGNFNGVYNKDVDNDYNKLEGTWVSQQGNSTITIKLQKIYEYHYVDYRWDYYEDLLIGEYKIVANGVEIFNSLTNLVSIPITEPYLHNIISYGIIGTGATPINNGSPNERGIHLQINEPNIDYIGVEIFMNYYIENGVEKAHARIQQNGLSVEPYENAPSPKIKFGLYTFVKQP